jgi:hypothetical protein
MRKLILALIILFMVMGSAHAFDTWTTEDTVKEGMFLGLLYLDKSQLEYAIDHQCRGYTQSPFVGLQHGDKDKVQNFFYLSALLHPAIAYVLPRPYRNWWQLSGIVIEAYSVGNNMSAGVGFSF